MERTRPLDGQSVTPPDGERHRLARRTLEGVAVVLIVALLVMTPSVTGLGREGRPSAKPAVLDSIAAAEVLQERNRGD